MKSVRTITVLFFLMAVFFVVNGQSKVQPRKVKVKDGVYTHLSTKMTFPKFLFDEYQRESVYSFDRKSENIGVTYEKNQDEENTTFSLYLYPAGDGVEGRLRGEYQSSLYAVAASTKNGLDITQRAVQHEGEKYICNGFRAIFTTDNGNLSQLTIFESGTWFYKLRVTSNFQDTTLLSNLEAKVLQTFDPTLLAGLTFLNEKVTLHCAPIILQDSTLFNCAVGSALRKIDWVMKNVDAKGRATGFPDLYIDLHVEGLKAFLESQYKEEYNEKSDLITNYLRELQLISDADFLYEFVMEQYDMILIIPENTPNRYEEYLKWKSQNDITINLYEKFYVVLSFAAKK